MFSSKLKIGSLLLLSVIVVFVGTTNAQKPPNWYTSLETAIKTAHPKWKVKVNRHDSDGNTAQFYFVIQDGNEYASVEIIWFGFGDVANASETLRGYVTIYNSGKGPNTESREFKEFGDEGVLFFHRETKEWHQLMFRREKVTVEVRGKESIVRELAKVIDQEIQKG